MPCAHVASVALAFFCFPSHHLRCKIFNLLYTLGVWWAFPSLPLHPALIDTAHDWSTLRQPALLFARVISFIPRYQTTAVHWFKTYNHKTIQLHISRIQTTRYLIMFCPQGRWLCIGCHRHLQWHNQGRILALHSRQLALSIAQYYSSAWNCLSSRRTGSQRRRRPEQIALLDWIQVFRVFRYLDSAAWIWMGGPRDGLDKLCVILIPSASMYYYILLLYCN